MTSLRPAILSYVKEKYKSEIEYLWYRYPNYAMFSGMMTTRNGTGSLWMSPGTSLDSPGTGRSTS